MSRSVLVTGGLGFIGSAYVRWAAARGWDITNVDLGTYAADARRVADAAGRVRTRSLDVGDDGLRAVMEEGGFDLVVHFAAETHVTRSERQGELFFRTNVEGTENVLRAAAGSGVGLVVHVSTDEVYGPCLEGSFRETDKLPDEGLATSPYARSKAVADDLAMSFADRLPVIVVRPTNCYGPWQHPEKAIPRWTIRALSGRRIPVWGDGGYVRDWMFVDDAVSGLDKIVESGSPGEVYNLGPGYSQTSNLQIASTIARLAGLDEDAVYLTAYDRPQHDRRYAVDASKLRALGWEPSRSIEEGLAETIEWYRTHESWWRSHLPEAERLYDDDRERQSR